MDRCEKYADWIADAAAGGLMPGRETQLLGHTEECDACREAYRRARELAACVDRGVASLVAGEASPYFASRLRARIAEERAPVRSLWRGRKPVVTGLLVAAVVVVAVVSRGPLRHDPQQKNIHGGDDEPAVASPWASNSGRAATPLVPSRRRVGTSQPNSQRRGTLRTVLARSQPEVLVPPGQLDAILQFARAVGSGEIDGQQLLAAQEEAEKPLEIAPLEIAPLSPPQPEVTDTPDGRK